MQKQSGKSEAIGKVDRLGMQRIWLNDHLITRGSVLHQMGHAAGLTHEVADQQSDHTL